MALTATVKTDLYRFFAIAFDAAPGVTYMTQLAEASAAGMTVEQIVEVFTTKQQFTATYPAFLTAGDFAAKLVNNVVGGSASDAAKAEAAADIEAALSAGWSRGKVIYQVFNNLASLTGDPKWGGTAAQMANQVAYAQYYTEVLLGDTTNLATLRGVIAGVTPVTDVTPAAIDAVLNPPPVVVVPSYALSANAASADEGASVLFTLTTANVAAGSTFTYTLGGVNSSDVAGGSLTGVATVGSDGKAVIQVNLAADGVTDGAKTLTVSVAGQTAAVAVNDTSVTPVVTAPSYALTAVDSVAEGAVATFLLQTTGLSAGSQVGYKITGAGSASGQTTTGVFTVDSAGRAAVALVPAANTTIGDSGALTLELLNGLTDAKTVTVTDATSKTSGVSSITAANAGSGIVTITVDGTAAQVITLSTDQVTANNGFVVNALAAPVTVNAGTGNDKITVIGGAGNIINTGAGNDTVILATAGNTTIDVGTGSDTITGTSGNESVIVGSGDLSAADAFDLGAGTDTVTISGNGNVVTATNLKGVENLVLNGTKVTFNSAAALATVKSVSGSSATSEITVDVAGADVLDLTGLALDGIKQLTLNVTGGVGAVTLKADAADLTALGAVLKSGAANLINIETDVAGYKALAAADTGITGTKTVTDTVSNIVDNKSSLTGATLVVSGSITGADALALSSAGVTADRTISMTVAELLTAAQYPDQKAALTLANTKIEVVGNATVAQAAALNTNYGVQVAAYQAAKVGNKGIAVSDTPVNVAAAAPFGATVSSVNLAAGSAVNVLDAVKLAALPSASTTGSYSVLDTATNITGAINLAATPKVDASLSKAASVTLTTATRQVTTTADALELKELGAKLSGGYDVALSTATALTTDGLSAIGGAAKATLTGTVSVTQLGQLQAANAAATVTAVQDNPANLVAGASKLSAVTLDLVVEGNATVAQAASIQTALNAILAKTGSHTAAGSAGGVHTNQYVIADTKAAIIATADAGVIKGAATVTVSDAMTLAEGTTLRGLADASGTDKLAAAGLTYNVTDTASALASGLAATTNTTTVNVLAGAGTVTATGTATVAEAKTLGATYSTAVQVDSYAISDTVAKVFGGAGGTLNLTAADTANATKLSITGDVTVAQLGSAATAGTLLNIAKTGGAKIFDKVYAITDTVANVVAQAANVDVQKATTITMTGTAAKADLANIATLNTARAADGKSAVAYTFSDAYQNVATATAGEVTAIKAATSATFTGTFAAGANAIDGNALVDLAGKMGTAPYSVQVTSTAAEVQAAQAGVLLNPVITKITVSDAAFTVASAKAYSTAVGSQVAAKTTYSLTDTSAALTVAADAATVTAALDITASDAVTAAKAESLLALTGSAGKVIYSLADSYANVAAKPAVADGATAITVSDSSLSVAQYANLLALSSATTTVTTTVTPKAVVDSAANVSAASAAVLGALTNVAMSDVGYITLNVSQARALENTGTYKIAAAASQPGGATANVKVLDTTANLLALKADSLGATATTAESMAILNVANTAKLQATDVATLTATNAETLTAFASAGYRLSDVADNLVAKPGVLGKAQSITVTTDTTNGKLTSAAEAKTILTANSNVSFDVITDTAAEIGKQTVAGTYDYAGAIAKSASIKVTDSVAVTVAQAAVVAAGAVPISYSLTDTAANLAKTTSAGAVAGATALTMSGAAALASEAAVLAGSVSKFGVAGFAVTDTAANLVANVASVKTAGGNVTVTGTQTVAQYTTLKANLAAKLVSTDVTDSAAAIADFLIGGSTAGSYTLTSNTAVNVAQFKALAAATVPTASLKVTDTSANLLTLADAVTGTSFTASDVVDLATAKQLTALFEASAKYSIATTADRFVAAYSDTTVTDGTNNFNLKDVLKQSTALTVDGVAITLGKDNASLTAAARTDYNGKIAATVAELQALPAALKTAAGYVVVDSLANITAAGNAAVIAAGSGYVVKDTAANIAAAATSVLATASGALGIQVTDATTAASIGAILAATNADSYTVYSLSDTAANLAASGNVAGATTVTVTDQATAAQAQTILTAKATAVLSVTDSPANLIGMGANLAKAAAITADADTATAGLQGVTVANAAALLASKGAAATLTLNIKDSAAAVAAGAAATRAAAGTITVDSTQTDATAAEAKTLAGVANISGGFKVTDTAAALTTTATVTTADLALATSVSITGGTGGTAATVAQANTLLGLSNIAKGTDANNAATFGKALFAISDSAKALSGASAANLEAVAGTVTVAAGGYATALTASEATALAAVDAASAKLTTAAGSVAVSDSSANILAAANAAALAKVASIAVTDSVSITSLNAVRALNDGVGGNAGQLYSFKLADSAANLIIGGAATVQAATAVQVTGDVSFADAKTIYTTNTLAKFDKITATAANLTDANGLATGVTALSKATAVVVTGSGSVANMGTIVDSGKLSGTYSVTDSASSLLNAINSDSGKALLDGAAAVGLASGQTAKVAQAAVINGQLANESALALSDSAANLGAANASAVVAVAASVIVEGSATNDALAKAATAAKVTYAFTDAAQTVGVAGSANGVTTFAAGVDVLSLKAGDVISLSGLAALTLDAGGGLLANEYRTTQGYYTADGSFIASASGTDLLLEIGTDGTDGADEAIVLVGTTTLTGTNANGVTATTGVTGFKG